MDSSNGGEASATFSADTAAVYLMKSTHSLYLHKTSLYLYNNYEVLEVTLGCF